MFHCKTYDCKLSERACIKRQDMDGRRMLHISTTVGYNPYLSCIDCEQGKQIKKEAEEMAGRTCDEGGCGLPHKAKGKCLKHYSELKQRERTEKARKEREEPKAGEQGELKKYSSFSNCKACGNYGVQESRWVKEERHQGAIEIRRGAYILRTCTRCNYNWRELPLYRAKEET